MHSCQFCLRAELQLTTRVSINLTKVSEREEMVYARGLAGATRTGLRSLTHNDVRFVQCLCFRKDDNGAAQRGPCVRLPTIEAGMKIPTPLSNQKSKARATVGPCSCRVRHRTLLSCSSSHLHPGHDFGGEEQEEIRRRLNRRPSSFGCLDGLQRGNAGAAVLGWPVRLLQNQNRNHLPPDCSDVYVLVNKHMAVIRSGQEDVRGRRRNKPKRC
jgi:hypothetical protein